MIREALAGKRIAITGSTGFLGTALVERLLRSVPGCELVLVVRAGRRTSPAARARREIFGNDAFRTLRAQLGDGFDAEVARRVTVVAGDVAVDGLGLDDDARDLFTSCDTVVHSAAIVSFDSPIDVAAEVNLLGPVRVVELLRDSGSSAHLVAVSTAYVAGTRRGRAAEAALADTPFSTEVDWRAEVAAARRARADADAASRDPELLARFAKEARQELGAAGPPLLAAKTEKRREKWMADRLVEAGRSRAKSLGWPDAYAYTKALAERAVLEVRGDVPVTVVRPSIIESAWQEPHPGWIRGFRMAEPVLISYGRGLLSEFPGIPEGVVDVIPVDLVVATIITVAARGPEPEGPGQSGRERGTGVYQVATGNRNPLYYRNLVNLVREYFLDHPLYDSDGQPIVAPDWSFSGRGRAQRQLARGVKVLQRAEQVVAALPIRGKRAEISARLEERRDQGERALDYVRLYGSYAETEAVFDDTRLRALWASMSPEDQAAFNIDTCVIDWKRYVQVIHLPSVVRQARVRTTGGTKEGPNRYERGKRAILSPDRHIAAFDLENTLIASNVVESYAYLASRRLPDDERARFTLDMLRQGPGLLALDRRDRGDFLRHFYRRYEDAPADRIRADAWELFSMLLSKSFPAGIRRVREHRALGHKTLLITGALDFVIEPLRPLFDDVVCARLAERDGLLTGEMIDAPPTGEARAIVLADYAKAQGLDLAESVVYADSASDLPMLEAVGHPVAVNAEPKLAAIARKRGWHVEQWTKAPGAPVPLLPLAPRGAAR
ncbi:MAG TPA: HAD-IB family phosphatase [Acidimicrobiales bacterium]|nr:HAD-IB family phosphatase [Acidimicrobiales bacterium]